MAKKRKQYVAHISKARSARAALKDLAVGFCANNDHLHLINTKHKRLERRLNLSIVDRLGRLIMRPTRQLPIQSALLL